MGSTVDSSFLTSLISGGIAGLSVDVALFPLDTLKTRLQSQHGFLQSGGFRQLYKGLGPAAAGSAPNAALFFCTYDSIKKYARPHVSDTYVPFLHMFAASMGELLMLQVACLVKVPIEIVKQRQQATVKHVTSLSIVRAAYRTEGFLGMFRGFKSTVLREIPFSVIQFPIWEVLMKRLRSHRDRDLNALEVALCGAAAGGFSAAVTTPLDVAKTRIMLADLHDVASTTRDATHLNITTMLRSVYREGGVRGLFAGFVPRVVWITVGGGVFFGVYEASRDLLTALHV